MTEWKLKSLPAPSGGRLTSWLFGKRGRGIETRVCHAGNQAKTANAQDGN